MPVSTQGDSRWTIPTALSFIHGRGGDLHDYASAIEASGFYATECIEPDGSRRFPLSSLNQCSGGHLYNFHPIAVSLMAIPFVNLLETSMRVARPLLAPIAGRTGRPWASSLVAGDLA